MRVIIRSCLQCGESYSDHLAKTFGHEHYCSKRCLAIRLKLKEIRKKEDEQLFKIREIAKKNKQFSKKALKKQRKLKKQRERQLARAQNKIKSYEFFKSDVWRRLRFEAIELYGNVCQCCGRHPPSVILHVDHIKPRSLYPQLALDINNLQILCEDCNIGKGTKENDFRSLTKPMKPN